MSTRTIFVAALICGSISANAQVRHRPTTYRQPGMIANQQGNAWRNTQRTTATSSRLVSMVNLNYNTASYDPQDSSTYAYAGENGGSLGKYGWEWQYDTSYMYTYNSPGYVYQMKEIQTFDANNNATSNLQMQWDISTSTWVNAYLQLRTFDAMNNMIQEKGIVWNTGTNSWDTASKNTATYDGSHNMLVETDQSWTGSAWENSDRYTNTYDASNNMLTSLTEIWNTSTSAWENNTRYTDTYDGMNNRLSELGETWSAGSSTWEKDYKYTASSFVSHQPVTGIFQIWNGITFDNFFKDNYSYNSYNQPDYYYSEQWDAGTGAWSTQSGDFATRYHYQTYTTRVDVLSDVAAHVTIYPMPAAGDLTVAITWDEAQPFSVTLMDLQGRMYTSYNVPACKQYKEKIATADVPPGNYLLSIESGAGRTVKKITVVK